MFLKRLALEILPLHIPIMFQCWQAEIAGSAPKLDQYLQTTCSSAMSLIGLPSTPSYREGSIQIPLLLSLYMSMSEDDNNSIFLYLYNNSMGRQVTSEKRVWGSASTLPEWAQVHLKPSVMLNLTYYAETSIQESLSWGKKKQNNPQKWSPVFQRKWDSENHYGDKDMV